VALIANQVPPVLSVVAHLGRGVQRVAADGPELGSDDLWDRYQQGGEPRRAVPPP